MPIFEFECSKCGYQFEELVRRSGQNGVSCPKCRGKRLRRMMSTFSSRSAGAKDYELKPAGVKRSCSSCTRGTCKGCI
jgi:putative FmdB family regulatory protein